MKKLDWLYTGIVYFLYSRSGHNLRLAALQFVMSSLLFYCPQRKFGGKVMFLNLSVILFTGGMGVCPTGGSA